MNVSNHAAESLRVESGHGAAEMPGFFGSDDGGSSTLHSNACILTAVENPEHNDLARLKLVIGDDVLLYRRVILR